MNNNASIEGRRGYYQLPILKWLMNLKVEPQLAELALWSLNFWTDTVCGLLPTGLANCLLTLLSHCCRQGFVTWDEEVKTVCKLVNGWKEICLPLCADGELALSNPEGGARQTSDFLPVIKPIHILDSSFHYSCVILYFSNIAFSKYVMSNWAYNFDTLNSYSNLLNLIFVFRVCSLI